MLPLVLPLSFSLSRLDADDDGPDLERCERPEEDLFSLVVLLVLLLLPMPIWLILSSGTTVLLSSSSVLLPLFLSSMASMYTVLADSGNGISCAEGLDLLLRLDREECGMEYVEPGLLSGSAILCADMRDDEQLYASISPSSSG